MPTPHILDQHHAEIRLMLAVRDLDASRQFYVDHFGFAVAERFEADLVLLQRSGFSLYLVRPSPPTADRPGVALTPLVDRHQVPVNLIFRVTDVRTVHASLNAQGLPFLTPPAQPPWGGWRCFAQDPDGYLIEIEQP